MTKAKAVISFLLLAVSVGAQPYLPGNGPVYTSEEIPKIHISIDEDSLNTLYLEENWYSDHEYPALFVFESESIQDTIPLVGFRFRGNTARDKIKKSFKVSFNTFVEGAKYYGLEKLNLNAEVNDPAMMRSRLCWDLFRKHGIPAPRSNHVEVYINEDYYGLYLNTEHIDEEFCELRFGSQGGNLYKCSYPANLDYISDNPDDYKMAPWGDRTYELKTNEEWDDYSDLAEFIGFLNLASDEELECGLVEFFNVYAYLKVAAIDVLTGNWDGYIYNQNNFYLYHNPKTDQFEYIPYDTDNTWGIDWSDRDWSTRNIYNWSQTGAERPLFNRLMDIDSFRDIFSWHIGDILDQSYSTAEHLEEVQNLHAFITASALADPYRPLDWGFSNSDFLNSLEGAAGGHVDFGVLEFADLRKTSALNQLEPVSIATIPSFVEEDFEEFPESFKVRVAIEGPECAQVELIYSVDGVSQPVISQEGEGEIFEFAINPSAPYDEISYNVVLTSSAGEVRSVYCNPRSVYYSADPNPVINEVMSSNQNTTADEYGEFDDWVEIFNPGEEVIHLEEYFLTDNSASPTKWHFPVYELQPGEFILVWADRDLHQGPLHSNFRLDAGGEEIYLFRNVAEGIEYVDGTVIPALPGDFSYGREADAELPWVLFQAPTPGASNSGFPGTEDSVGAASNIYPNPSNNILYLPAGTEYRIKSLRGKELISGKGDSIDVSGLVDGIYIVDFKGIAKIFVKN